MISKPNLKKNISEPYICISTIVFHNNKDLIDILLFCDGGAVRAPVNQKKLKRKNYNQAFLAAPTRGCLGQGPG